MKGYNLDDLRNISKKIPYHNIQSIAEYKGVDIRTTFGGESIVASTHFWETYGGRIECYHYILNPSKLYFGVFEDDKCVLLSTKLIELKRSVFDIDCVIVTDQCLDLTPKKEIFMLRKWIDYGNYLTVVGKEVKINSNIIEVSDVSYKNIVQKYTGVSDEGFNILKEFIYV